MTASPVELPAIYTGAPFTESPLRLVTNEDHRPIEGAESRKLFDKYFGLRDDAQAVEKIEGHELHSVQEDVRAWIERSELLKMPDAPEGRFLYYTGFSEDMARKKILGLVDYLASNHADKISPVELEATSAFIESTFAMYNEEPENGKKMTDADGSFAFVVPARVGRKHLDYGKEVEPAIPAFRYLPNELRSQMLIGLPPFVIDTYQRAENGRRGYLVFTPVYEDMIEDFSSSLDLALKAVHHNVNEAVDFAYRRFGVGVVGLGATLPAFTDYGKTITNPNVITTTGHGGTVDLVRKTAEAVLRGKQPKAIGVLGLGAIGNPIARVIAGEYPDAAINLFDTKSPRVERVQSSAPNMVVSPNERSLIEESDIIISAITGRLDLHALGMESLDGKVFIDDSQPGSIDPDQAEAMGGAAVWVIGRDTQHNVAMRRGYDYATMVNRHSDGFGCEFEAASIARYMTELEERGMPPPAIRRIIEKVALSDRATVQNVRYIGALFTKYGIKPSQPQAHGRPVTLPTPAR